MAFTMESILVPLPTVYSSGDWLSQLGFLPVHVGTRSIQLFLGYEKSRFAIFELNLKADIYGESFRIREAILGIY